MALKQQIYLSKQWVSKNNLRISLIFQVLIKKVKVWPVVYGDPYPPYCIEVDLKLQRALEFELVRTSDMTGGNMFHPYQLFSTDAAEITMKRETGLNYFTISFDKYHFYHFQMNDTAIKQLVFLF